MIHQRPARPLPCRAQMAFVALVAVATALILTGLRGYPWSLAIMMSLAFGALAYTGWGTVAKLVGIYDRRSVPDNEAQGKVAKERSNRR